MAAETYQDVQLENPTVTEPTATEKKKLTTEERLQIENIYLKVENMRLQTERLQADVVQAVQLRQQYQGEMSALQTRLAEKYGVDMTKVKILPDGTILPQG